MNTIRSNFPGYQRGASTLLIAMLLLIILTVVTLFATRVGLSEQRSAGSEYRQKITFQVAESGLSQAIEYLKGNTERLTSKVSQGWLFDGNPHWQPCSATKPAAMKFDPCDQLPSSPINVRNGSYRYMGPGDDLALKTGKLPLSVPGDPTSVGGFASGFETYATLCRLDTSLMKKPGDKPLCSVSPAKEGTFYVTIVSVGKLADEKSAAVVKQSFGTFRLIGRGPDVPLVASGIVDTSGSAELIPNPDAGGFGVPVSIWSWGNAKVDQSNITTCQLGEWMVNYGNSTPPSAEDILNGVCTNCTCKGLCPGSGLLSGDAAACPTGKDKMEGEDILDRDSNFSDASPKVRDTKTFPDDLFAYVFGVPSGTEEELFLKKYAKPITDCAQLSAEGTTAKGFYWYQGGSTCGLTADVVGSLQRPVVLVSDKPVQLKSGMKFFGIIFIRQEAGSGTLLQAVGGGQIYGSVIIEGDGQLGGGLTIVYNKAVLQNIMNSPDFVRYGPIPGSWSDNILLPVN